jgi:archaellum component FlaC
MADKDITLGTIMEHLRAMEGRINKRFEGVDSQINGVNARIDRAERNLTRQIDGIDKRLDEMEIEKLPERVERIEQHLELAR